MEMPQRGMRLVRASRQEPCVKTTSERLQYSPVSAVTAKEDFVINEKRGWNHGCAHSSHMYRNVHVGLVFCAIRPSSGRAIARLA